MFEKFNFTDRQVQKYYQSAWRDLKIVFDSAIPEVIFRFCYDALLKLAIAVCARENLRVKARQGHHIELIEFLARFLKDKEIITFGNEMRTKRNWDLYGGGTLISQKEAMEYQKWVEEVFEKADKYFKKNQETFLDKFKKIDSL